MSSANPLRRYPTVADLTAGSCIIKLKAFSLRSFDSKVALQLEPIRASWSTSKHVCR
jgi:hypothetical protein